MRVVLLQVRDDEPAEAQERLCFLEACGLEPSELESINLVHQPRIRWSEVEAADALIVGGAGAHSATQLHDFTRDLEGVILRVVEEGMPYFGSCFGHHVLVTALGGQVVTDQESGEVGTFEVELTEAGLNDPLLDGFPGRFAAQFGHHDRVARLPRGMVELGFSRRCRFQMLRVVGKPIYSSQFHCELTDQHLKVRLEMYRDAYVADRTSQQEMSKSLQPSPWADKLLRLFVVRHCQVGGQ